MSDDRSWGGGKEGDLYWDNNVPLLDIRQAKGQLYKNGGKNEWLDSSNEIQTRAVKPDFDNLELALDPWVTK